jgi:hypothetical protein
MMDSVIYGLVSSLIWSAFFGTCLIAAAALITTMTMAGAPTQNTATGTTRARDVLPPAETGMPRTDRDRASQKTQPWASEGDTNMATESNTAGLPPPLQR